MDTETREELSGVSGLIKDTTLFLMDKLIPEDVQYLATEDEAWEVFLAETNLSREEADELRQALKKLTAVMAVEEKEKFQKDLQEVKRFWNELPQVKRDIEQRIGKLCALAEEVDKMHRGCTISNMVADSTGAASGVMTILGFALALVTAGSNLALSAAGMGLGAVSTVSDVTTPLLEETNTLSAKAETCRLISISMDTLKELAEIVDKLVPKVVSTANHLKAYLKDLGRKVHAFKETRVNPHLVPEAGCLMNTGTTSDRSAEQVLGDTALEMTRGAQIRGGVTEGVSHGMDVYSLVGESMHLYREAEAELAKELRRVGQELEKKLEELVQFEGTLPSDPIH
ncbi:apolipoprotein L3-like isoform X2 [Castor canadensis]